MAPTKATAGKKPVAEKAPAEKKPKAEKKLPKDASATDKKKKKHKKSVETYKIYIFKVLKQVHPDIGISSKAMGIMNSFINDIFEKLAQEASRLARYNKKNTLSSREIQTAVRLVLPGELAKHAVSEGTKAVTKFTSAYLSIMVSPDSGYASSNDGASPTRSSPHKPEPLPASDTTDTTYLRFLASNAEAGSIIGKGGTTISDFQSRSNARIQLSRNYEYFPGTSDRVIMVSGTFDEVLDAVGLILTKLINEFYAEDGEEAEPRSKVRLIVPNSSCGGLIGKGGSMIRSFIEDSGANIKISPHDNSYIGLTDRLVTIIGTLQQLGQAINMILSKLSEDVYYVQSIGPTFPYAAPYNAPNYGPPGVGGKFQNNRFQNNKEDAGNLVTLGVADEHIGLVVGRGGRNIMEISQVSGARIKISERGDFISGTCDRKVTITGSQRATRVAEAMIMHKVSSASAPPPDATPDHLPAENLS
ncbi:hypothetical protein QVD17_32388 [Tagetes erecta]|uniref:Histone H2B n=1 Tax=Tagetes erecta TaxID=13708 RepID=A0AAD8NPP2_TARER|nr:hypothetical protein QVD17_32388 [Tagetes erecta]